MEIALLRPRKRMRRCASDSRRKSPSSGRGTIFRREKPTFSPLNTIPAQSSFQDSLSRPFRLRGSGGVRMGSK
jgi:hypothetical protein